MGYHLAMRGKPDRAGFLPPADIVGMPADHLTELLDQVLAEDEPARPRPSSSGLLAVAEAAAQNLPDKFSDDDSLPSLPDIDPDLLPQLRIAHAVLSNPDLIDGAGADAGTILVEAPQWNRPAPPPTRFARRKQAAHAAQPPTAEPPPPPPLAINLAREAEAALVLAEVGSRPLTAPGGWTAETDAPGTLDFPDAPPTDYPVSLDAALESMAPEASAFIPAGQPTDMDLLAPGSDLRTENRSVQPVRRPPPTRPGLSGPDFDLLTTVAAGETGGAPQSDPETPPSLSTTLVAPPRPALTSAAPQPLRRPPAMEPVSAEPIEAPPPPPPAPPATIEMVASPVRTRKRTVAAKPAAPSPAAAEAAPPLEPAEAAPPLEPAEAAQPLQPAKAPAPPPSIKASLKPSRRPPAPKAAAAEPAQSPPPVPAAAPVPVVVAPPPAALAPAVGPLDQPEPPPARVVEAPVPPPVIAAAAPPVAEAAPQPAEQAPAPAPEPAAPEVAPDPVAPEVAPDPIAPEVAPDPIAAPSDQPESGLAAWAEAIIAANRDAFGAPIPRVGSGELPPNQEGLEALLADPPPATDFAALDLLTVTWGKATAGSDRRALLATAYNLSRNFGLPGKLPMASSRAWRMLDARLFRADISNQLSRIANFIADWQKTQKTFLILEHGEIELIEFLFESLDPATDLDQMASVMNFKVLSNRRMGLIRRIPSRLRKEVNAMLPARHQDALLMLAHYKALLERLADPNGFAPIVETASKMLEEIDKLMKTAAAAAAPQLPPGQPPGGGQALGRIG
ncbi:conserved hypothetical protein [Magnetospirillum sp. LM-5]|uniref:hypothetical protein n=1 Tax=Magnetospirillum sp. LM-5 TaxID=2681466 RepID=UPI00137FB07A|nr:hypothetical protein [Magnetospirillum sp. LM-5]CAA7621192.1 conserved hypothetical protein [Magnetospirillum sp. LM-5]